MSETDPDRIVAAHSLRMMKLSDALTTRAACQAMMDAPKTYNLLRTLAAAHVDVSPGTELHTALMEFARLEATKSADLVAKFQRSHPITIHVTTSEEARRLIDTVRSEEREVIIRLADALVYTAPAIGPDGPCWCDPMMEKKNGRHWDAGCTKHRDALRRAGRIP